MPDGTSPPPVSLAQHLVAGARLTPAALERPERMCGQSGEALGSVLTRLGLISERDLADALAGPGDYPSTPVLAGEISRKYLKRVRALPLALEPEALVLAMADPLDDEAAGALGFAAERPVRRLVACATDLEAAWERLYGGAEPANAPPEFSTDPTILVPNCTGLTQCQGPDHVGRGPDQQSHLLQLPSLRQPRQRHRCRRQCRGL